MKRLMSHTVIRIGLVALVLLAAARSARGQIMPPARYEGQWQILPNGDVKSTVQFKLPMQLYRMCKDADMHMLELRNFEAGRCDVEVADRQAKWDDLNRTLTLTMTIMGMARNMGTHWEAKMVPGQEFSNLDETKKVAYFHFSLEGAFGKIMGQDIVHLPPECSSPTWNASARTLTYVMPKPPLVAQAGGSGGVLWWALFAVFALAGAGMWVASYFLRPVLASLGKAPPQPPIQPD